MNFGLPSRSTFSCDIKSVPWTDGCGDQQDYEREVDNSCAFLDVLPNASSNKMFKLNRGIVLQSNIYGRAHDLCNAIYKDIIRSNDGVIAVKEAVNRDDSLRTISNAQSKRNTLLKTKRGHSKTFTKFEARFSAQRSKFNSLLSATYFPSAMAAFLLLTKAKVDAGQQFSILTAASPSRSSLKVKPSTDYIIDQVEHESVATVLRQCGDQYLENRSNRYVSGRFASILLRFSNHRKPYRLN